MLWGPETWPLYGVERWPQIRGFLSAILNGHAIGTKVSGRYRQGGRTLEVVVKRGSTVSISEYVVGHRHSSPLDFPTVCKHLHILLED